MVQYDWSKDDLDWCKGSPREDESFGYSFTRSFISPVHERSLMNAFISKISIWIGEWT